MQATGVAVKSSQGGAPVALPSRLKVLERLGAQLYCARAAARVVAAGLGCSGLRAGAAVLRDAEPQVLQLRQRRALPGAGSAITCFHCTSGARIRQESA